VLIRKNVALGYDVGKIIAGCLVFIYAFISANRCIVKQLDASIFKCHLNTEASNKDSI